MDIKNFAEYARKLYGASQLNCTIQEYVQKGYFALDAFNDIMQAYPPNNLDDIKDICNYLDEKIHDVFLMKELKII